MGLQRTKIYSTNGKSDKMKKFITRYYKNQTEKQIDQADKEHWRLICLGYKVVNTYSFLTSCQMNYELIS